MTSLLFPRNLPRQKKPLTTASWTKLHAFDALITDNDASADMSYKELRPHLDVIPRAERGIDWAERVVKLYHRHQMKAGRCLSLIKQIGPIRENAGEGDKFTAFTKELAAIAAPYVLTIHGFNLPFRHQDQTVIIDEIDKLMSALAGLGFVSFINSGTLLGAVREGQFLGHDDDADFAILIEGETEEELVKTFISIGHKLNASGLLQGPVSFSKASPVIKIKGPSGVVVDLFPIWIKDGRIFIWPHTFGELTVDDVFPLGSQILNGKPLPAPQDAEKTLALNYGEGWRQPDTGFKFPWDLAREKFASFIKEYKRQRYWPAKLAALRALLFRSS